MCSIVILRRPGHPWPLIIGANRDEAADRPAKAPGRHWPDRPEVVAGLDELAGGTWLGLNDWGVFAAITNRVGSLGPEEGKRSRGELPLEALDHADAETAARALSHVQAGAYRGFNLIIGDARSAYWISGDGRSRLRCIPLADGLTMVTARDADDLTSPRIARYRAQFEWAPVPDPDRNDWQAWQALLAARDHDPAAGPGGAMCVIGDNGFGTVSSSLLALPAPGEAAGRGRWLHADGRPGEAPYRAVAL